MSTATSKKRSGRRADAPKTVEVKTSRNGAEMKRRMPVERMAPFDLGQLGNRDTQDFTKWAGWTVTYRGDVMMSTFRRFRSGDQDTMVAALARVVVGWNFVDEDGLPLAQPTPKTFAEFVLPDDLLLAMVYGFGEAISAPKATATSS